MPQPEIIEREPPAELADVVRRLWYLRMPSPQPFEQIVPMPFVHLVVNLSDPYRIVRHGREVVDIVLRGAFLSGVQLDYLVNENPAHLHHVGAELLPWALPAFGIPAREVANRVIPAPDALVPPPFLSAADRSSAALETSGGAALDALVATLLAARDATWRPDGRVVAAARTLLDAPDTPIAALVARSGLGSTRFVEVFRMACGITPKRFAEVCRHHRFLAELPVDGPLPTWTELIATRGYYDQPHFIREFRRFTGMTPSAYLERRRRFGSDDPSFLALAEV